MTRAAIELRDLRVTYAGPPAVRAVDGVGLRIAKGEVVGLLGESGSGKSTIAHALLGLVEGARIEGTMTLDGLDLRGLDEQGWRDVRWRRLALGFQSPAALNPVLRVGDQIAEPLRLHLGLAARAATARAAQLLEDVGLGEWAAERLPHELSGGQRRLVLLALALSCEPEAVVLDEPTSGLDPQTRRHVVELLGRWRAERQTALLVLSHDVEALRMVADRVAVLYRGWLAEAGPAPAVLDDPRNPYSRGLLDSRPTLATVKDLRGIRGDVPDGSQPSVGCPFYGRCTQGVEGVCTDQRPALVAPAGEDGQRLVACARGGVVTVLAARGLRKAYVSGRARRRRVEVLDGVSLDVREGEVVGLVGATGAGKSTLAQCLLGLLPADGGSVTFEGRDLLGADRDTVRAMRRRAQMLFQDPYEALSARMTIGAAIGEPLDVHGIGDAASRRATVRTTAASCRLPAGDAFLERHTHELSGGQLQRVALARALVLEPKLLVADEPVAMLDPSEQAKMLQLLKALQVERGMAMILVAHDLAVVVRAADRVLVLDGGRVVEEGTGSRLLAAPRHPVTRALLAASGRDELFGASGRGRAADDGSNPEEEEQRWISQEA